MTVNRLFLILLLFSFFGAHAQEIEIPLIYNPAARQQFIEEQRLSARPERGGGASLSLPFFDDFSRNSLPSNDPETPVEWQRWADNDVYINSTFPLSPMTIGVATLDGLAADGTPYSDTLWFPAITDTFLDWGLSDSLTSLPINLAGYTTEDNIYLVFNYQGGGLGNAPDADGILGAEGDSLILDFYSPLQQGQWSRVWEVEGGVNSAAFDTVFVPISDFIYLQDGFRFRFKNYCTLHGALDHWNLDYVFINNNVDTSSFSYSDVAFQYPNNTLLNFGYTSMPWTHYESNPELYTLDEWSYYQRNLGSTENITTNWRVFFEGNEQFESVPDANTQGNGFSEIVRTVSTEGFVFETALPVDSASFEVCASFDSQDIRPQNDSMCFTQHFSNYYSYDDGTAERAYGIQSAGGKMAVKFNAAMSDTLIGVYMYFIPVQYVAQDQSFILQVWDDASGQPGNLLTSDFDNFNFSMPHYYASGPNLFVYFDFTDNVFIDQGDFYVGYIQQNAVSLNVGLDKNTSANATKLFFQLQGQSWQQSSIAGSVMVRPIFKSGLPDWVNVEERLAEVSEVYPNPANDEIRFMMHPDFNQYNCRIIDMTGRVIREQAFMNGGNNVISVVDLATGNYMMQILSEDGQLHAVRKFIRL
jgi:hypothetical protein